MMKADRHSRALAAAAAIFACGAPVPATAQSWQYEFTPYLWAAGLSGEVRIPNQPTTTGNIPIEQSFGDIWSHLELGLMGSFEARNGRWGVLFDGIYFRVSAEGTENFHVDGRLVTVAGGVALAGEVTQQSYTLAGFYRTVEGRSPVDVFGGLRYNSVRYELTVSPGTITLTPAVGKPGNFTFSGGTLRDTQEWVDPFVGVRGQHALTDRLGLIGYFDLGGFGVGSKLAWQALGGFNYAFTPGVVGKVGYRYIVADYDKDGFKYDMTNHGAYVGVGIRW